MSDSQIGAYTIAVILVAAWFWRRKPWLSWAIILAAALLSAFFR